METKGYIWEYIYNMFEKSLQSCCKKTIYTDPVTTYTLLLLMSNVQTHEYIDFMHRTIKIYRLQHRCYTKQNDSFHHKAK